jgi:hypothetical protein
VEDDQRGVLGEDMARGLHGIGNGGAVSVVAIDNPLDHGGSALGNTDHHPAAVVETSHRVFDFPQEAMTNQDTYGSSPEGEEGEEVPWY